MRSWTALLAGLAAAFLVSAASAETLPAAAERLRAAHAIPSLGLGVIDRGRIVFVGGFGTVDGHPASGRERYRAASISKLFTAQAVMKLGEQGRLGLDDDIGRWVPQFAGRGLTARHLLTHHSGLRDLVIPVESDDPVRIKAYLDLLARFPPAAAPGAAYAYTDADFNLLGALVAAVSGETYAGFVQRTILVPLGLRDTEAFPAEAARAGLAPPGLPAGGRARPYDLAFAPSEGLTTSARDLTAWTLATLKRDRRVLRKTSYDAMMLPQTDAGAPRRSMGLGWQVREETGVRIVEHAGSVRGYNALVIAWPDRRRAFVILTNADDAPRWEIARALEAALDAGAGR